VTTTTLPERETRTQTDPPKMWNVVLLDDDQHTYEYVMIMVQALFGLGVERAFVVARQVDTVGRAVCLTTHKEHAELKRDQILGYGADPRIMGCKGSMSAVIEPAEFEGDGEDEDGGGRE
jgi:ATP-dependent Clp protease adaptor protein ClpS